MRALNLYTSKIDLNSDKFVAEVIGLCEAKDIAFVSAIIDGDIELEKRFSGFTPVIIIGPYRLNNPSTIIEIEVAINATLSKEENNNSINQQTLKNTSSSFSKFETFSLWFSKSYVWVVSFLIILFAAVPFFAPILEWQNRKGAANVIYKTYGIFCHQLAYRSYFIGGEQPYYPRELARLDKISSYEEVTGMPPEDLSYAREYTGNKELGYKIALCERDIAIYLSMGLFGMIFQLTGRKIKSISWFMWVIIALLPIAIDGFSQLPGLATGWPSWMPMRESTPLIRTITGALFGFGTAWYMFPLMEETMQESRFQLSRKKMVVDKMNERK